MRIDPDAAYRALRGRDARFDGEFFAAVSSTGIYCRPSCPARTPQRRNVGFYPSAAAAQRAGFRACKRCRPDAVPGSAAWNSSADLAARAARLIADGAIDRVGVGGLANQLGYSERQIGRVLMAELGAPALALARAQRAQTARVLLENTSMPASDIAFAAGFGSIRQFNDTVRAIYASSPTELRQRRPASERHGYAGEISLRLAYRPPMDLQRSIGFLIGRLIPGVESHDEANGYQRTMRLPHAAGLVAIRPGPGYVNATLRLIDHRDLAAAIARIRRLLDLDADPVAIDETLSEQPLTAIMARARPGLRAIGAVDGFEMAVRAVVGQQVSVAGAMTVLGRLVADYGEDWPDTGDQGVPRRLFPRADVIAGIDPSTLPMPRARGRAVVTLAAAIAGGGLSLDAGADRSQTRQDLLALPGIGPWTADYLMLRAMGDPDIYLGTDLAIKKIATQLGDIDPTRAAPWRSYLTHQLWATYLSKEPT
jgi:AraC family transcriptional regulator of adaptative response / DNA-3-methyladenine glycosylase II